MCPKVLKKNTFHIMDIYPLNYPPLSVNIILDGRTNQGGSNMNGWKKPADAFQQAINEGRLSRDRNAANYAGDYMYMGPTVDGSHDAFKHIVTRQYLAVRS